MQPGSAFKAFTLSAALRDDISLKSRFWGNSPLEVPGTDKEVNNEFDNDYGSSVDLVTATEESINTAFVDLSLEMGARKVVEAAVDAGIPEDTPGLTANAVTTLGTASVRNIDMATAYATFAAQGEAAQWYIVQEVKGANGGTRYQAKPKTSRAFDEDVMADVSYALQQVVKNGTGAEAQSLGRPAAGKTGTAALRPDTTTSAWFVGLHPAALGGGRLLQGHRQGRPRRCRRPADVLRRRVPGPDLDGVHDGGDAGQGGQGVPAAGVRR